MTSVSLLLVIISLLSISNSLSNWILLFVSSVNLFTHSSIMFIDPNSVAFSYCVSLVTFCFGDLHHLYILHSNLIHSKYCVTHPSWYNRCIPILRLTNWILKKYLTHHLTHVYILRMVESFHWNLFYNVNSFYVS